MGHWPHGWFHEHLNKTQKKANTITFIMNKKWVENCDFRAVSHSCDGFFLWKFELELEIIHCEKCNNVLGLHFSRGECLCSDVFCRSACYIVWRDIKAWILLYNSLVRLDNRPSTHIGSSGRENRGFPSRAECGVHTVGNLLEPATQWWPHTSPLPRRSGLNYCKKQSVWLIL